ncbi:MAG: S-methyl-5-thioribose-1-phosphate isomerase [Caldilineaceae bacterium]|nr:S-methyl-5-thioribose-1-phosphate isomerase [Caldilineaceae bacterium]MBP8106470.1 S-methyl-5-thioribose-1-phosphate isomerase [Caldilineaceae bacterium]MBP8122669.1 S-methyl-5-thioribose-1-phosphate isomerase [Caldilineaceae bacterium]MBP9072001.1 S-methyl-5-thioribose-1-phosphate isomerase [Caldilineaceae bacterium]
MNAFRSVAWVDGRLRLLDQRLIPQATVYIDYTNHEEVAQAILEMVVRGAPAIGAAAAYGLALAAANCTESDPNAMRSALTEAAGVLKAARPTAVNLFWAVDRVMVRVMDPALTTPAQIQHAALAEAHAVAEEDVWTNRQIGLNALALLPKRRRSGDQPTINFIHHCNTGSLATVDYGTALGIIRTAHESGRTIHAFLDETRPRLQGARLSAYELVMQGIPHTVIVDGASGHFMRTVGIDLAVVGCDRVAANGDTANKIGTYNLALVAHAHDVPFYVAAPTSTIDLTLPDGDAIEIEERPSSEISHIGAEQITPEGAHMANPAFDVTPARYITGIVTEAGVAYPPFAKSLPKLVAQARQMHQERQEIRA